MNKKYLILVVFLAAIGSILFFFLRPQPVPYYNIVAARLVSESFDETTFHPGSRVTVFRRFCLSHSATLVFKQYLTLADSDVVTLLPNVEIDIAEKGCKEYAYTFLIPTINPPGKYLFISKVTYSVNLANQGEYQFPAENINVQ